jgi:acyl-CoA synthetase (AMP-forming)/AMP-acid ligase II
MSGVSQVRAKNYTLNDLLIHNARSHGRGIAFRDADAAVTHRDHLRKVERLAAGLQKAGISHGDRVAILSKNRLEYLELIGAAGRLGAIVSAINWRLSSAEVLDILCNDEPKMVLVEDGFWPVLDTMLKSLDDGPEPVSLGQRREGVLCIDDLRLDCAPRKTASVHADDPLLLIHTAWTDGRPKAAMLSHGNLIANAIQLKFAWDLDNADVHLCCLPLFHITALSLTLATQMAGGCTVLLPKFDIEQAVELIARHQATLLAEFAPMLEGLLSATDGNSASLQSVRHVCGLDSPETIQRFETSYPQATFWVGYGQTEVSGLASIGAFRDAPGAAGFALPMCAIGVVDDKGEPASCGTLGEIVVRGPSVFLGYWRRPKDNEHVFRGGWLHTGDSGRFDEQGRLWYCGRLAAKELIKTGGENVYPAEVEAVLRQHPEIADAAVIGVPDAQWGETIKAVCVSATAPAPTESAVIDFVGTRIARYKRPRLVLFVPSLPKKGDGSNDREQIRHLYA